jgi:ectoine hydroxylase
MKLTDAQIKEYDEKGFLIFPSLISEREVAVLQQELVRSAEAKSDAVFRETSGSVRSVFYLHDRGSDTHAPSFEALSRSPRTLGPAQQLLRDESLYIWHTKCNIKDAIDGAIWQWHQDYGAWQKDGLRRPDLTTALVMIDGATEMGGCLYFVPGSHKLGNIEPELDESTSYKLWAVPKQKMLDTMEEYGDGIPIVGKPGTVVLFHPLLLHGSGHNMSRYARWQLYIVYNRVVNKPVKVEKPRPEWVVGRNYTPLTVGSDDDILKFRVAAE